MALVKCRGVIQSELNVGVASVPTLEEIVERCWSERELGCRRHALHAPGRLVIVEPGEITNWHDKKGLVFADHED